ncbi:MAG: hydantoinase B/oxoprolinase family protein [Micromonosporaceae bacterium]|nr:hydantoinase B/oxoprolinase family protein [Micromonosporaceae bacterium]
MTDEHDAGGVAGIDQIRLEALWTRFLSIADEVGYSIARTGFSTVLRENHDYSVGIFDHHGNMLAQSSESATGHIGAMPYLGREILRRFGPADLSAGDVVITNDPWIGCGHNNDLYAASPIYRGSSFVGMVVTSAHQMDIGGRMASPESRTVYEEGLLLPPLKMYVAGRPRKDIVDTIALNVRFAEKVLGDIRAQVAATHVGIERVLESMDMFGLQTLDGAAEAIIRTTERQMRDAIRTLPDGEYAGEADLEQRDDAGQPLRLVSRIVVRDGTVAIDFAGTSPQVSKPINCVLNYTRAYTVLGVKLAVAPFLPNNDGSYRPVEISAPVGSILNARYPAACHWRHFVGLRIPDMLFSAFADAVPEKVLAESGACPVWLFTVAGTRRDGRPFLLNAHAMGGLGARPDRDGVSAVAFPPNVRDIPTEVIETETPLIVEERALRAGSGGAGTTRGGLGEEFRIRVPADGDIDPDRPVTFCVYPGRLHRAPAGVKGGEPGARGEVLINGVLVDGHQEAVLSPGDVLTYRTPGGGGYGAPAGRRPELRERDVVRGYLTAATEGGPG